MKLHDFRDIDAVPAAEWAELARDDLYSTTAWMRCIAPFAGEPHMLLDHDGDAAAVGYLVTADHPPAPFRRPDRIVATRCAEETGERFPDEHALVDALLPSLVLGGQRLHDSTVLLGRSRDTGRARSVLREFLAAVHTHAAELGARSVMFPYVSQQDPLLGPALATAGYLPVPEGAAAHLDVTFSTMTDYLAARPSPRRSRIRSEMRKLRTAGVRTRFVRLTHETAERLAPHEVETWRRHGVARNLADSRRSLHGLAELDTGLADGRVVAGLAELDGRLLAFTTGVHYRNEVFVRNFGRLPGPDRLPVYFGLVYYAHVDYAIDHGVRRLYYGLKSEEAKRARGCTLVPQHGYLAPVGGQFPAWLSDPLRRCADGSSAVSRPLPGAAVRTGPAGRPDPTGGTDG